MTLQQVKDACDGYKARLPQPKREVDYDLVMPEKNVQLGHVSWMCAEISSGKMDDNIEKIMRWLGFIQGVLWSEGVYTIQEMKDHNR